MANFGSLYNFQTNNGIVIPDTSEIKSDIEAAMKLIFGDNLDVTAETPMGRLIEALTFLMVDCVGVNAQNANNFNPVTSVGTFLENLGSLFGIERLENESDDSYRKRIANSQSRGTGYAESVRQAISKVTGVTSVTVIENGFGYPRMLPTVDNGVVVPAHSMFICVGGWTSGSTDPEITLRQNIAKAILATKSAGCGFCQDDDYGTVAQGRRVAVTLTDSDTGSSNVVVFYAPLQLVPNISVVVDVTNYTGTNVDTDVKNIIKTFFADRLTNATTTATQIATAINLANVGLSCTGVAITVDGTATDEIVVKPYQAISVSDANITVTIV